MYSTLLIIYSIILFIFFNLYLSTSNVIILISSILLFIYILFNLYRIQKSKIKKVTIIYLTFIVIFSVYLYSFSYLYIENSNFDFLETNRNIQIDNKIHEEIVWLYSFDDYSICIVNKCSIEDYFKNDINLINKYLKSNYNLSWIIKVNNEIENLIKKKNLLQENWISTMSYKITFDLNNFTESYLLGLKSYSVEYLKMKNNIFINKKQYFKYLNNYYYKVYDLVSTDNIEWIADLDNEYERKSIWNMIINRKYIYNHLIVSPKNIYSDMQIVKKFKNNMVLLEEH